MKGFGATPVPEAVTEPTWKFATLAALADAVDDEVRAAA
jgi:putative hydrolase of the HAD superfamily